MRVNPNQNDEAQFPHHCGEINSQKDNKENQLGSGKSENPARMNLVMAVLFLPPVIVSEHLKPD